jgi:hypothetical protein
VSLRQTGRGKDVKAVIRQAGKSPALDFYFVSSAVNRPSSWSGGGKSQAADGPPMKHEKTEMAF